MSSEHKRFVASLTVPNRVQSIRLAATFLVHAASAFKVPGVADGLFEEAVVEALNNTLKHGPRDANACIVCEFEIDGRCLKIRVLNDAASAPLERTVDQWATTPESEHGLCLIAAVFPAMRTVSRDGHHGIEMERNF